MITHQTLIDAATDYYRGEFDKSQRFGQFFINKYMPSDTIWPELFYEKDSAKALQLILTNITEEK